MGKRLTKAPKIYFIDCGLVCYLTGINNKDVLMKGAMAGALFENYCIQETVKQIFNGHTNYRVYYIRAHNNLEVDLIIEKNTNGTRENNNKNNRPTLHNAFTFEIPNSFSNLLTNLNNPNITPPF